MYSLVKVLAVRLIDFSGHFSNICNTSVCISLTNERSVTDELCMEIWSTMPQIIESDSTYKQNG